MAKIITQETYDDVIKENIVEFSMAIDEARQETIQQFEAQGVNLANIIKDLTLNESTGLPIMNEAIETIKSSSINPQDLILALRTLTDECNKSVPHRVQAAKLGALDAVSRIIHAELARSYPENSVLHHCILAANALTNHQPDIFDDKCLKLILQLLDTQRDTVVVCDVLRWIQKSCVLHEMNRQMIMNEDVLVTHLKPLLLNEEVAIVKEVCTCFRMLILDDDVRVEFGKAHDHARAIATETLPELTNLMTKFKSDQNLLADLILTIASLIVRNELCQSFEDAGGLRYTLDAMVEYPESAKLIRESLKLLKALAGNDKVKIHIIQNGAAGIIEGALSRFKTNEGIAKAALACISILALRVKENSTALFESGISETILETMKAHPDSKMVQRNAAWAIRNMVSRAREQCETFINQGAEELLVNATTKHPSIGQDIKSALRDLGCKVQLNEEWKGVAEKKIAYED